MNQSEMCNEQWRLGYIAGFQSMKPGRMPSIPPRPGGAPAGTDPLNYFRQAGFEAGRAAAAR